jgi:hypothetical protein
MKNLIKAATILNKTSFVSADMETDSTHDFFKIDQIKTKGCNFILICCQNLETVSIITDGDIAIGSNIMNSDVEGNRTLLYSGPWTFTAATGAGAIWMFALIPDFGIELTDLHTDYNSLPFDEYANLDNSMNEIQDLRTEIIGPFIPALIDIIFRVPVAQTEIDVNVTVYGLNV